MSSFEKIVGGKLKFKGGLGLEKLIDKKRKKKKAKAVDEVKDADEKQEDVEAGARKEEEGGIDDGTGYAPIGEKKTKKYEDLFPFETVRFGYVDPMVSKTREEALDERSKRKADRYCK